MTFYWWSKSYLHCNACVQSDWIHWQISGTSSWCAFMAYGIDEVPDNNADMSIDHLNIRQPL